MKKTDEKHLQFNKWLESLAFILFIAGSIFIIFFHEPWLDESISWQIAKNASLKDILFTIPHYEGHPPLWHLILKCFALFDIPYEISIKSIAIVLSSINVFLIIFKSPFHKIIKITLPFTYFLFYQYTIISRPYSLLFLFLILIAINYDTRNNKPLFFILLLALLCLSSAYGIVLAGGISLVWLIEIIKNNTAPFSNLLKDIRIHYLFILLLFSIILILEIFPRDNTYIIATNQLTSEKKSFFTILFYFIFILPAEVTCYNFSKVDFSISFHSILPAIISIIIWFFLIKLAKKNHTSLLLFIPYILFSLFSSLVYIHDHHIGIGILYFIFFVWINIKKSKPDLKKYEKILLFVLLISSILISIIWTISSCIEEIKTNYAPGKSLSKYIKENHLQTYNIMIEWDDNITYQDINHSNLADIMPYFDNNIFYNFHCGSDQNYYINHKILSRDETNISIEKWKLKGYPDILIGDVNLNVVFQNEISLKDYQIVFHTCSGKIWKGTSHSQSYSIYMHKGLVQKLAISPLSSTEIIAIDQK